MPRELSIVVVTAEPQSLRRLLSRLRTQGAHRLEVVIAAFPGTDLDACAAEAHGFDHVQVLEASRPNIATAEFEALQAASAAYVAFCQASAWPRAGYVEAILDAIGSTHATAVGPSVANANPRTAASRAGLLIQYGEWVEPADRGPAKAIPGHSSAYQRQALLTLGDELVEVLDAGAALQTALLEGGGTLYLEPSACVEIFGVSRFASFLANLFAQSLHFANLRKRGWSRTRRALYTTASPLLPVLRFARIAVRESRRGRGRELCVLAPVVILGLVASAVGELVGYSVGLAAGTSKVNRELFRFRYVQPDERHCTFDADPAP